MNSRLSCIVSALFVTVMGIWGMTVHCAMASEAGTEPPKIHSGAKLVECRGFIMAVDHARHHVIVNEKWVHAGMFRIGNEVTATRIKDMSGQIVDLGQLNVGQWVDISGYAVSRSEIIAVSIEAVSGYFQKNRNTIEKL